MPQTMQNDGSIHTSDRALFLRCRRKWGWGSRLRMNLVSRNDRPVPWFWFGSGWHFSMEDYHGWKHYPSMAAAFEAYVYAHPESKRPYGWEDMITLAQGMANYYTTYWQPVYDEWHTLWLDDDGKPCKAGTGTPQVEIDFSLQIPGRRDKAPFAGTFDGIIYDDYGRWWIKEVKTAREIDTSKLDTDAQITGYCLAAEHHYRHEIAGVVYLQFLKDVPKEPRVLANGDISDDIRQRTTYHMFRPAVIKRYGEIPDKLRPVLDKLLEGETTEGNKFIRVDRVYRNSEQTKNEIWKLQAVAKDMLNPNLSLYPNPTNTCAKECEFYSACLAMDDGSDWESMLEDEFVPRSDEFDWRSNLVESRASGRHQESLEL